MIKNNTIKEDLTLARFLLKEAIAQSKSSKFTAEQKKIILKNIKIQTANIKRLSAQVHIIIKIKKYNMTENIRKILIAYMGNKETVEECLQEILYELKHNDD